jgi:hypothetical protein
MKLKATCIYRTRSGATRTIRLRMAWKNLRGRISGRLHAGNGARPWKGLGCAFKSWAHFRAWAIANGYSRARCSLDRIDPAKGYSPENCRWVTRQENTLYQNYHRKKQKEKTP